MATIVPSSDPGLWWRDADALRPAVAPRDPSTLDNDDRPDRSGSTDDPGGGDDSGDDDNGRGRHGGNGGGNGGNGDSGDDGGKVRWITVASFSLPTQAHLARLRLEGEEIDCVLVDEHLVSTNWLLSPAVGGIKLQVPEDQAARAREILGADAIEWDPATEAEIGKCVTCGQGEYQLAPLPRWTYAVSILLLGIPLLFLPRRWKCDHCHAWMETGWRLRDN